MRKKLAQAKTTIGSSPLLRQTKGNPKAFGAILLASALLVVGVATFAAGNTYYVATTGSDANDCTSGSPCLSFDRAWDRCEDGDTVIVRAGTYGAQTLTGDKTDDGGCTVQGETIGGGVKIGHLQTNGDYATIRDIKVDVGDVKSQGWYSAGSHVLLERVDILGGQPYVNLTNPDVSNVTWREGVFGGKVGVERWCPNNEPFDIMNVSHVTLEKLTIWPQKLPEPGQDTACGGADNTFHLETFRIDQGAHHLLFKDLHLMDNDDSNSARFFVTEYPEGSGEPHDITWQNNYIGGDASYAIAFREGSITQCRNMDLHYNTWTGGVNYCASSSDGDIIGNAGTMPTNQCWGNVHRGNVWSWWDNTTPANCSQDTWIDIPYNPNNVNDVYNSQKYLKFEDGGHITDPTSPLIDGAEENCATTLGSPATDYEGDSRPSGDGCDAGADEYVTTTAHIFVSDNGNDNGVNCVRHSTPRTTPAGADNTLCRTLNRAYSLAQAGDTIEVRESGDPINNYGNDSIPTRTALASGAPVTIRPAAGQTVNFTDIGLNSSKVTIEGPNFNARSIDVGNGGNSSQRITDVVLDGLNIDAQNATNVDAIWVGNITNFTVKNSQVGNTMAGSGSSDTAKSVMTCAGNSTCHVINMVFENNLFYDADTVGTSSQAHLECIWAGGVQGFTLRKNTFRDCTYFDVFITVVNVNNQPQPRNHVFEDNIFGQTINAANQNAGFTINLHGDVSPDNFDFHRNTFEGAMSTTSLGGAIGPGGWRMSGNIFGGGLYLHESLGQGCRNGIVFSYNLWTDDDTVNPEPDNVPTNCNIPTNFEATSTQIRNGWVNSAADNFALTSSSPALNRGNPAHAGTTDALGAVRGNPPDIGALEYEPTSGTIPVVTLGANPTSVTSGTASALTWSSSNASSCTASANPSNANWTGSKPLTGTSVSTGNLTQNTEFTLTCTDGVTPIAASTTVTIAAPQASCSGSSATICEDFSVNASNLTATGGTWGINGGKYNLTAPTQGATGSGIHSRAIHTTTVSTDFTATVDASVVNDPALAYDDLAIIFGYQDANNYYYASWSETNDTAIGGIFRVQNGTQTQLDNSSTTITAGTTYSLKVTRTGNQYRAYRNNTEVASTTDAAFASGRIGVGTRNDSASFDNLIVETSGSTIRPADINQDSAINLFDLSILLSNYGRTSATWNNARADINANGTVDIFDLTNLLSGYGT